MYRHVPSDFEDLHLPVTIVTSGLNEEGLRSLVEQEMMENSSDRLFGTLDLAIEAAIDQRIGWSR